MFGFDDQMLLLRAWNDMALSSMNAAAQVSTAMLGCMAAPPLAKRSPARSASLGQSGSTGRSWYRAPDRSFEAAWFGMTWPFQFATPMAAPFPFALQPFRYWTQFLQLPSTTAAMPFNWLNLPSPPAWPAPPPPWTANIGSTPLAPMPLAAPANSTPFATYRSESGHAVAQVTFPNQVIAAVALPATAVPLLDTVLAWSRMFH